MILRRKNWPVFLAIALLGPLLGAFVTVKYLNGECWQSATDAETTQERASETADRERAEQFVLPDGDRIALDEIAPGRSVAVVVMKAPWCTVCQRQLKRISNRLDDVQSADGAVVGLTTAEAKTNRRLTERLDLGFPILGEPSKRLHKRLGLWRPDDCHAIPGVVFLDESGTIKDVHRGRYPGKPQGEFILDTLRNLSN